MSITERHLANTDLSGRLGLVVEQELTVAQITSISSSPFTLIRPNVGYFIEPVRLVVWRKGARYNTQPGALVLRWVASTPVNCVTGDASALTNAASDYTYRALPGGAGSAGAITDDAAGVGGKAIDIFSSGNPTISGPNPGSNVVFRFWYLLLPIRRR